MDPPSGTGPGAGDRSDSAPTLRARTLAGMMDA